MLHGAGEVSARFFEKERKFVVILYSTNTTMLLINEQMVSEGLSRVSKPIEGKTHDQY